MDLVRVEIYIFVLLSRREQLIFVFVLNWVLSKLLQLSEYVECFY